MCNHCKRPIPICDADTHGCGTTPARDAVPTPPPPAKGANVVNEPPPSGWLARGPLL